MGVFAVNVDLGRENTTELRQAVLYSIYQIPHTQGGTDRRCNALRRVLEHHAVTEGKNGKPSLRDNKQERGGPDHSFCYHRLSTLS